MIEYMHARVLVNNFTMFSVVNFIGRVGTMSFIEMESKKISNNQELIQSDPISCPQNQKGNN